MRVCKCGCGRETTFNDRKKEWNLFLKGHFSKKAQFDRKKFSSIKTEADAYWLGFFIADGYVRDRGYFGFHLSIRDREHIDKYLRYIRSTHSPKIYRKNYYRVEISDKDYCERILKPLGLIQGKSATVGFPRIERRLYRHLIRWVFDGDGWVCPKGVRSTFGIIGNGGLMESIQQILVAECGVNKTKLLIDKRHKSGWIRSIQYGGANNMRKIYKFLYNRATISLDRKRERWEKIFQN